MALHSGSPSGRADRPDRSSRGYGSPRIGPRGAATPVQPRTPTLRIAPRPIGRWLACVVAFLIVASTIGQFFKHRLGHDTVYGLVQLFNVDNEGNVPAWYSSGALLACSALLGVIAGVRREGQDRWWRYWLGLCLVFLYLSLDEAAAFHERLTDPVRELLNVGGFLYWAWVIPGLLLVAVLGAVYLGFLRSLPRPTLRRFILAAVLFLGGAVGVEMLSAEWYSLYGRTMGYALLASLEECLEMSGVIVFLLALLRYLGEEVGPVQVVVGAAARPEPGRARRAD